MTYEKADLQAAFVAGYRANLKRGRTHVPLGDFEERCIRVMFDRYYDRYVAELGQ